MYAHVSCASVLPEQLLKSALLIALYSVASEYTFCEELKYNLLYRWFLDMNLMERSFDSTVFTKNRTRLLAHDAGRILFDEMVCAADQEGLLSDEHFSVDGILIEAAVSLRSSRSKERPPVDDEPGNPSVDFHGECRSNETDASTTGHEARLLRKGLGEEAPLAYLGHALMEKPLRPVVGIRRQPGHWHRRAGGSTGVLLRVPGTGLPASHPGRRPRLRQPGSCAGSPRTGGSAYRTAETLGRPRSHNAPSRQSGEPTKPQTVRRELRLDDKRGRLAAHRTPRRGAHGASRTACGDGLQPEQLCQAHGQTETVTGPAR